MYLSVVPGNARAIRLYEGMGFEATGDVDDGEVLDWKRRRPRS